MTHLNASKVDAYIARLPKAHRDSALVKNFHTYLKEFFARPHCYYLYVSFQKKNNRFELKGSNGKRLYFFEDSLKYNVIPK